MVVAFSVLRVRTGYGISRLASHSEILFEVVRIFRPILIFGGPVPARSQRERFLKETPNSEARRWRWLPLPFAVIYLRHGYCAASRCLSIATACSCATSHFSTLARR